MVLKIRIKVDVKEGEEGRLVILLFAVSRNT